MLKNIFELLKANNYYSDSELIDFAKGGSKIPETLKEAYLQFKRDLAWL